MVWKRGYDGQDCRQKIKKETKNEMYKSQEIRRRPPEQHDIVLYGMYTATYIAQLSQKSLMRLVR